MHVLICNHAPIPVFAYGGTERVIWDLGKALDQLGHRVSYLVPAGSTCPFGRVLNLQPDTDWSKQIPEDVDVVHFQFQPERPETIPKPWLMTQHGNSEVNRPLPLNTIFLSNNHAQRHGSSVFVHNGLDWSSYGPVNLEKPQNYHHFLGKAAWRVKNVQGAIDVARQAGCTLKVLGGDRLNFRRGFRFTLSPSIHFYGMVGGEQKMGLLRESSGLIFPVRWHEPFGLAVIERLTLALLFLQRLMARCLNWLMLKTGCSATASVCSPKVFGNFSPTAVVTMNVRRTCSMRYAWPRITSCFTRMY